MNFSSRAQCLYLDRKFRSGTVKTDIDTVENEFGQSFNLKEYINERNSTVGIDDEITNFPDAGIQVLNFKA